MKWTRYFPWLLLLIIGIACISSYAEWRESGAVWHKFGVNDRAVLCVPESDMDPVLLNQNDESTDLHVGSGRTPGFGFLFGQEKMEADFQNFHIVPKFEGHPYVNALSGSIGFVGPDDQNRLGPSMRARNIADAWYSKGECSRAVIRPLAGTNLFKVKCSAEDKYASIWDRPPDSRKQMPNPNEFVVATCDYADIQIGPYAGNTLRNCSRIMIVDGFILDYEIQEQNLGLVEQIDLMLKRKIVEWERNCQINGRKE